MLLNFWASFTSAVICSSGVVLTVLENFVQKLCMPSGFVLRLDLSHLYHVLLYDVFPIVCWIYLQGSFYCHSM